MTIEQLKSGSWRVRKMVNGKRYSVTIDYKPTRREAEYLIDDVIAVEGSNLTVEGTVQYYADKYLAKCKKDGLSPTTTDAYQSIINNTPQWFRCMNVKKLRQKDVQNLVDEYSANHSAKSTKNFFGFYRSVICDLNASSVQSIKLPKMVKKSIYEPSTKDIRRIMEYFRGTKYECVLSLLCCGLRRGEAVCITSADLDADNILTIDKDIIRDGKKYIVKDHPKTEASNRRILIPQNVADMIRSNRKAYEGNPQAINRVLQQAQVDLGIPKFHLHILRHYAAALLHKNNFTDKQIMAYMGWSTPSTMHGVYNYNLDPEESQKPIADAFSTILD